MDLPELSSNPRIFFCDLSLKAELESLVGLSLGSITVMNPDEASHLVAREKDSLNELVRVMNDRHITLFFAGEAEVPDFNLFDFAVGFDLLDFGDRYVRPHPLHRFEFYSSLARECLPHERDSVVERQYFCDFIYSNPKAHPMRENVFAELGKRKRVDSWGAHLNNRGDSFVRLNWESGWREETLRLRAQHRFSITIENARHRGYTSEKIITSLLAGSVPIYYGNDDIAQDFNPNRFVNLHDFQDLSEGIEAVMSLESDHSMLAEKVSAPMMTPLQEEAYVESQKRVSELFLRFLEADGSTGKRRGDGTRASEYLEALKREKVRSERITVMKVLRKVKFLALKAKKFLQ